jgi:hypothetical protein
MKALFPSPIGAYTHIIFPGGEFGNDRGDHEHGGVDLGCARIPLLAQANGVIIVAGVSAGLGGNKVELLAEDVGDFNTHLFKHYHFGFKHQPWQDCIYVERGQRVKRGQLLGIAGDSGNAVAVHDHYEHWVNGRPIDPLQYLKEYQVIRRRIQGLRLALVYPGSVGPDIPLMQRCLKSAGFDPGMIDGVYGPRTQAAVGSFQESRGLKRDYIVGRDTWTALLKY